MHRSSGKVGEEGIRARERVHGERMRTVRVEEDLGSSLNLFCEARGYDCSEGWKIKTGFLRSNKLANYLKKTRSTNRVPKKKKCSWVETNGKKVMRPKQKGFVFCLLFSFLSCSCR